MADESAQNGTPSESPDMSHHYGELYQRTAELESEYCQGMTFEDRAATEVEFGLECADMTWEEGDQILDIACGVGEHSFQMAEQIRKEHGVNVNVDARDFSDALVTEAGQRAALDQERHQVRDHITFRVGDMLHIDQSLEDGEKYKMITIYGSSFMYLRTKQDHENALKDFYDLLVPGGKLVIEFRERTSDWDPAQMAAWCEKLGIEVENVKNEAVEEQFPSPDGSAQPFPDNQEQICVIKDRDKGDGFYFYFVPPIYHPAFEGLQLELDQLGRPSHFTDDDGYIHFWAKHEQNGEIQCFVDRDGVEYNGFSRVYLDEMGGAHDMGATFLIDYMSQKGAEVLMNDMMPRVGFQNIHLEQAALSPDGAVEQFVIVAEKP